MERLHARYRPSQCCPLEHLASVQGVTIFKQFDEVFREVIYQATANVQLSKRKLIVVPVVKDVDEVSIERVDVLRSRKNVRSCTISKQATCEAAHIQPRKLLDDRCELVMVCLLREFDLPHVELANTGDFIACMNDCRCLSLCFR